MKTSTVIQNLSSTPAQVIDSTAIPQAAEPTPQSGPTHHGYRSEQQQIL